MFAEIFVYFLNLHLRLIYKSQFIQHKIFKQCLVQSILLDQRITKRMQNLKNPDNQSDSSKPTFQINRKIHSSKARQQRLRQIDALYKSQIDKIYKQNVLLQQQDRIYSISKLNQQFAPQIPVSNNLQNKEKVQTKKYSINYPFKYENSTNLNIKQSKIFRLQQAQHGYIQKHKNEQIWNLNEAIVKDEQGLFKKKIQVTRLLNQLQFPKEELFEINRMSSQSELLSLVVGKVKQKAKQMRFAQQQASFQKQKDQISCQKQQQRFRYLAQTNQVLKLGQAKLKQKNQDLRTQLTSFIACLQQKEHQLEEKQVQLFHAKREFDQLNSSLHKIKNIHTSLVSDFENHRKQTERKQTEMKAEIGNHLLTAKRLGSLLEEKDTEVKELQIRVKFLEQEIQRVSRESNRWHQRYDWLEKSNNVCLDEKQQEKAQILKNFEQFRLENNPEIIAVFRSQLKQATLKTRQCQDAYRRLLMQFQNRKSTHQTQLQQAANSIKLAEQTLSRKLKEAEQLNSQKIAQIQNEYAQETKRMKEQNSRKQTLMAEEIQSKMKTLLSEHDQRMHEQMVELQHENLSLRKEIESLNKVIQVKESLITLINGKRSQACSKNQLHSDQKFSVKEQS